MSGSSSGVARAIGLNAASHDVDALFGADVALFMRSLLNIASTSNLKRLDRGFKCNPPVVGDIQHLWLTPIVVGARRSLPRQVAAHGSLVLGQRGGWTGFWIGGCARTERILVPSEAGASVAVIYRHRCRPAGAPPCLRHYFCRVLPYQLIGVARLRPISARRAGEPDPRKSWCPDTAAK